MGVFYIYSTSPLLIPLSLSLILNSYLSMDHHHNHHYVPMPFTTHPKKKPKPNKPPRKLIISPPPLHLQQQDHPNSNGIARPCTECGKKFSSWKALFGHMRCHPERQWRGINPPPNFLRPANPPNIIITNDDHDEDEVVSSLLMLANGPPLTPTPDFPCHSPTTTTPHHVPQIGLALNLGLATGTGTGTTDPNYCSHISSHVDSAGRFECAGCKKVFGSHQALGGHRASHKNVKGCFAITKKPPSEVQDNAAAAAAAGGDHHHCNFGDHNCNNNNNNVHKCSTCLRVFSSGQALGGHMRCHWEKKLDSEQDHSLNMNMPPIYRAFDLNLPASIHDDGDDSIRACGDTLDLRLGV